jgi:energy-coupling factor transporter ATP-binding protein EcfA2
LFLGPTGSGKTRIVQAAAEILFGDSRADQSRLPGISTLARDRQADWFTSRVSLREADALRREVMNEEKTYVEVKR